MRTQGLILSALVGLVAVAGTAIAEQPPEVKLKVGHFRNKDRNIGLVIDLTHHEARIQWDGDKKVIKLDPQHGSGDRTDWIKSANHVVLQTWPDGRAAVFVQGSDDAIDVRRDGDAQPI
jgi:hypothetical protein